MTQAVPKKRSFRRAALALATLVVLAACGPVDPRFGSVTVSATAPRATLTGHTSATGSPAIDLSAGCPGFVDTGTPEHLVRLDDASAITISARSLRGPLAIAVVGPTDVRCDSDEGTGHAPHVTITQPGEYAVHVGALEAPADLPYELSLSPSAPGASEGTAVASSDHRVSVTVTTTPSGATVRTPEGETLGTTPAMFVLTVPESEMGHDRRFILEMPGHATTEAVGRLIGDAMVVHATLADGAPQVAATTSTASPVGPSLASGTFDAATSGSPVPIRDYRVATQTLEVPTECSIGAMSVDVDAQHAYSQDLRIVLHGPGGQTATLANHTGGSRSYAPRSYAWDDARGALHAFGDTSARGTWSLEVRDDAGEDEGVFRGFTLHFTCGGTAAVAASAPPTATTHVPSRPRPSLPRPRPTGPTYPPQAGVLDPWSSRPTPPTPPPTTTTRRNPGAPTINPF